MGRKLKHNDKTEYLNDGMHENDCEIQWWNVWAWHPPRDLKSGGFHFDVICCKKWKLHDDKLIFSFDCSVAEVGRHDYCTAGEVGAIVTTGGAGPPFSFEKEKS